MKLIRLQLRQMIFEQLRPETILLEQPDQPTGGQDQDDGRDKDEETKRSLYHMSQQSQQLHDMLGGDENLEPWVRDKIATAASCLEKAFKAITYDKGPGQGRVQ